MPYLEGERTPPLPDARGQLVGLTLANLTPANLARAAIEGVLWSLAYGVEVLREQTGDISRDHPHRRRLASPLPYADRARRSSGCRSWSPIRSRVSRSARRGRPPGR